MPRAHRLLDVGLRGDGAECRIAGRRKAGILPQQRLSLSCHPLPPPADSGTAGGLRARLDAVIDRRPAGDTAMRMRRDGEDGPIEYYKVLQPGLATLVRRDLPATWRYAGIVVDSTAAVPGVVVELYAAVARVDTVLFGRDRVRSLVDVVLTVTDSTDRPSWAHRFVVFDTLHTFAALTEDYARGLSRAYCRMLREIAAAVDSGGLRDILAGARP